MASSLCPYTMAASVLLLLCSLSGLQAMLEYQSRIPNGHKVGHPCFENTVWKGVGHQFHGGGGTINPFGEDFKKNGFVSIVKDVIMYFLYLIYHSRKNCTASVKYQILIPIVPL